MKRWLMLFCGVLSMVGGSGCSSTRVSMTKSTSPWSDLNTPVSAAAVEPLVQVMVNSRVAEGAGISPAALSGAIEGALGDRGFKTTRVAGDAMMFADVHLARQSIEAFGEFAAGEGRVELALHRARSGVPDSTLGMTTITARGSRERGEDRAVESLRHALADQSATWLSSVAGGTGAGIAANLLTVERPSLQWAGRNDAEFAEFFCRAVGSRSGVIQCVLERQSSESRTLSFRVVYWSADYPAGILNALVADKELGLRAR